MSMKKNFSGFFFLQSNVYPSVPPPLSPWTPSSEMDKLSIRGVKPPVPSLFSTLRCSRLQTSDNQTGANEPLEKVMMDLSVQLPEKHLTRQTNHMLGKQGQTWTEKWH